MLHSLLSAFDAPFSKGRILPLFQTAIGGRRSSTVGALQLAALWKVYRDRLPYLLESKRQNSTA
jgi:hypothetical protein